MGIVDFKLDLLPVAKKRILEKKRRAESEFSASGKDMLLSCQAFLARGLYVRFALGFTSVALTSSTSSGFTVSDLTLALFLLSLRRV